MAANPNLRSPAADHAPLVSKTAVVVSIYPPKVAKEATLSAEVACDVEAATKHAAAWQALADDPLERNVFYEPWTLLPAMRAFVRGKDVRILFVFRNAEKTELVGVFPLEHHLFKFSPVTAISLWRHPHCFLCTPLLKRESAGQALAFVLDHMFAEYGNRRMLAFRTISGDGPFHDLLTNELSRRQLLSISEIHTRPVARCVPNGEEFLRREMSGKRRRAILRRERKLARAGQLEYHTQVQDVESWIQSFLHMEAAGWKGRERTALNITEETREFFRVIVAEAHRHNRLMPISLLLNGRALAHRLSFVSGDEAFAFKSTYDEHYRAYSPGVLLELATLRDLHTRSDLQRMDSCTADAAHSPMNGMWREQRAIHTIFVMPETTMGRLLHPVLPILRRLQTRHFKR